MEKEASERGKRKQGGLVQEALVIWKRK